MIRLLHEWEVTVLRAVNMRDRQNGIRIGQCHAVTDGILAGSGDDRLWLCPRTRRAYKRTCESHRGVFNFSYDQKGGEQ